MNSKSKYLASIIFGLFIFVLLSFAQKTKVAPVEFKEIVDNQLQTNYKTSLKKICPVDSDATADRIFREYGAIFVSSGTMLPGKCIFPNEAELQDFQVLVKTEKANINGIQIELQKPAMDSLQKARSDAARRNLKITPRGGSLAAKRSFRDTVGLWNSRFSPGLNYWVAQRKISAKDAAEARNSSIPEQVKRVLEWEEKGIFFSKDLTKSILFSVAAPGASQHNFMLALDVEQFANKEVRNILAANGWFQTVKSDLPHFTYLGVAESDLPNLGLTPVIVGAQKFWIPNQID